ncbi:MAG: pseudouridine synthase, partial [Woeseiaceae bacterium]|nr:pseudouridine synthase [Woeseiaceae bacterium]
LMLLTDDGRLQARITEPSKKLAKTYVVQVEGTAGPQHIDALKSGVRLKDGPACAIDARLVPAPPVLWPRQPPIRYRARIPTSWAEISIDEGRNRQIRRMTAAIGLPTLRLIRLSVGPWSVGNLRPGESRLLENEVAWRNLESPPQVPL